ncbi:hypothetical protein ASF63_15640 [Microbacterium sp. Leaf320]|nr:hypothetical protein ASF63_15640 [Microbacterium sp. Leaf320]
MRPRRGIAILAAVLVAVSPLIPAVAVADVTSPTPAPDVAPTETATPDPALPSDTIAPNPTPPVDDAPDAQTEESAPQSDDEQDPTASERATITPFAVTAPTLSVVADGTAVFDADDEPGNDSGATNGIVRTNDTVQYRLEYDYDGPTTNPYLTSTLPAGMEWLAAPPQCTGPGTVPNSTGVYDSVTGAPGGDRRVLICQRDSTTSPGTESISPVAKVTTASLHGDVKDVTFDLGDADGTPVTTTNTVSTTVSAGAFYDLEKNFTSFTSTVGEDGVEPGVYSGYTFGITVSHPTRTGDQALKGITPLASPMTFTDDLSGLTPNTRLMTWATPQVNPGPGCTTISANRLLPNSRIGGSATSVNSVPNTGTISCTPGTPGGTFQVTLTGTDTRGLSYPTQVGTGEALPPGKFYVATGRVFVWTPLSDIAGNMTFANTYRDFDPTDVTGRSNYGDDVEPLANNTHTRQVIAGGVSRLKSYRDFVTGGAPSSASGERSGDARANVGSRFISLVQYAKQLLPTPNLVVCDVFDNTSQRLTTSRTGVTPARVNAGVLVEGTDYVLEYGAPTTRPSTFADMRAARCGDTDATWSTDPTDAALGGALSPDGYRDSVDRVRVRFLVDLPGSSGISLSTYLRIDSLSTLDPANNPDGTLVSNFGVTGSGSPFVWNSTTYDPVTHGGGMGDRITLVRGQVRLDKTVVEQNPGSGSQVAPGTDATFRLTPRVETVSGGDPGDPLRDVTVTDVMPSTAPRLEVNPLSVSRPDSAEVQFCALCDGSDWTSTPEGTMFGVRWLFGDVAPGTTLPDVQFSARVPLDAANGAQYLNTAAVSSPDDPSALTLRTASATAQVIAGATVYATKSTAAPYQPLAGPLVWDLTVRNATQNPMNRLDVIDVLPFTGDERTPASSFSGGFTDLSVENLPGTLTAYVTVTSPQQLDAADGDADGFADPGSPGDAWFVEPGTGVWACTIDELDTAGCPTTANATAVRFASPSTGGQVVLDTNETVTWQLSAVPTGNVTGDTYTNRFRARVNPEVLSRPVNSPDVPIQVQAPQVALVKQTCTAEDVSECEIADDSVWAESHTVRHGGVGAFRLVVTNTGALSGDVQVDDVLPAGLELVPGTVNADTGDTSGFTPTWTVGELAPGQSATLTFQATIPEAGTQLNEATATITDQFGQTDDASDSSELTAAASSVDVTKTVDSVDIAADGTGTITYLLTVTNTGAFDEQYTLRDAFAFGPGITLAGATVTGDIEPDASWNGVDQPVVVRDATVPAGGTQQFQVTATVQVPGGLPADSMSCEAGEGLRNTAAVDLDATTVTDVACVDAPAGALTLTKTAPSTVTADGTLTWTLTLTNAGDIDAVDVTVTDTLPTGVTFDTASGDATFADGTVTWQIENLAAGDSRELTVTGRVAAPAGATITNCAVVDDPANWAVDTELVGDAQSDPACASTDVVAAPGTGIGTEGGHGLASTGGAISLTALLLGVALSVLGVVGASRWRQRTE